MISNTFDCFLPVQADKQVFPPNTEFLRVEFKFHGIVIGGYQAPMAEVMATFSQHDTANTNAKDDFLTAWAYDRLNETVSCYYEIESYGSILPHTEILFTLQNKKVEYSETHLASEFGFTTDSDPKNFSLDYPKFSDLIKSELEEWKLSCLSASWSITTQEAVAKW